MDIIENIGKRGLAARNAEADVIDRLMGLNKRDEEKTWFCCSSDAQCRATRGGGSSCFDEKSGDYILNDFSEGNAKDTPGLIQGMYRGAGGRITPVAGKGIRIAVSSIVLGWFLL